LVITMEVGAGGGGSTGRKVSYRREESGAVENRGVCNTERGRIDPGL